MNFSIARGIAVSLVLTFNPGLAADQEWRSWKSSSGTSIEARLIAKSASEATLEKRDGKRITVKLSQLSTPDQEFLAAMADISEPAGPKGDTTIEGINAVPGTTSEAISCAADPKWSYHLYLPTTFHTGTQWPVCFVMDPGSGSPGTLDRYKMAAEKLGFVLAASKESKNEFADSDLAMMAMHTDVCSRIPVLEDMVITSGMSGGSRMAFLMAEMADNVGGVVACASGGGVYLKEAEFRDANLRRDTVVCSLIGSNDFNRREAVHDHRNFSRDSRLIWFVGNHDWAESVLIFEGMAHVYGKMLENSKVTDVQKRRVGYADAILAWAKEIQPTQPWTSHRWSSWLAEFPSNSATRNEAAALASDLAKNADVMLALKADKAIDGFAEKYLADGQTQNDKTPDAAREKDAEKKAAEFEQLPHGEILRRMGGPAV